MSTLTSHDTGGITMTKEQIEVQQQGLKCDATDCDYTYVFNETDTYTAYLNKPCPECGANLLTQEDHDTMMQIMALMEYANSPEFVAPVLPQEIQHLVDQLEEPDKKVKLKMEFVDGIPVMTSDDEEVQNIIDEINDYYASEAEMIAHIDKLEKE